MIHKKIGAFIVQDVQNPNETKTTAVTLRLYALILSVYFLVSAAFFGMFLPPC